MKFIVLQQTPGPQGVENSDAFTTLLFHKAQRKAAQSNLASVPNLSLIRRQKGTVISMKLVLREYASE